MSDPIKSCYADPNNSPGWNQASKVHDWRNHVGRNTRLIWDTLTVTQQLAIALDAQTLADDEIWE